MLHRTRDCFRGRGKLRYYLEVGRHPRSGARNALLVFGAKWYAERSAALYAELRKRLDSAASHPADPEELLSAAQGVIETLPV